MAYTHNTIAIILLHDLVNMKIEPRVNVSIHSYCRMQWLYPGLMFKLLLLFLFHSYTAKFDIVEIYIILVFNQAASCDPPAPEESGVVAPTSKKQTVLINAHICEHCHEVCRCTQVSVTTVPLKRLLSLCQPTINVPQGCLLFCLCLELLFYTPLTCA